MTRRPHLFVALSSHGYGHAAQTSVVVAALRRRLPGLRLTVQTALPAGIVREFLGPPDTVIAEPVDPGLAMASPIDVLPAETAAAYAAFHRDWPARIDREARRLADLAPDTVLANVAYLPLAAAARIGVPAFALCSLNWADLYRLYCRGQPGSADIQAEIEAGYAAATAFLVPEPGMPVGHFCTERRIGPLSRRGVDRRGDLLAAVGRAEPVRLVLVSLGGIPWSADFARWPALPETHFIVQGEAPSRPDMTALAAAGIPVIDLLASVDAVVSKASYGFSVEATCNGAALVVVRRGDWPEEEPILAWLGRHGRHAEIGRGDLGAGRIADALGRALARRASLPVAPTGGEDAAAVLAAAYDG